MKRNITFTAVILLGILFANFSLFAGNSNERSLSEILDKDGKIISGIDGSFNAEGYNFNFEKKESLILLQQVGQTGRLLV